MSSNIYQHAKLTTSAKARDPMYKCYEDLANAIILQVIEDYRNNLISNKQMCNFFRSDWCKALTKIDGEYLIKITEGDINRKINPNAPYHIRRFQAKND